jgi:hypothetical protein
VVKIATFAKPENVTIKYKKTTTPNPNKNLSKNEVNSAFSLKIGKAY